jgi:hypothetical protein
MKPETNDFLIARRRSVVATAKAEGLFAGDNIELGARVPRRLVDRAKERAGISSTTDLIEYALAKVALEDDFGGKFVARKGSIPADIKLDV